MCTSLYRLYPTFVFIFSLLHNLHYSGFFHPLRMRTLLSIHYFFLVMTSFAVKWLYFVSVITYLTYNVASNTTYLCTWILHNSTAEKDNFFLPYIFLFSSKIHSKIFELSRAFFCGQKPCLKNIFFVSKILPHYYYLCKFSHIFSP